MGNTLRTPTLGAITPKIPFVLTEQMTRPKAKANKKLAATFTDDHESKSAYYLILIASVLYFMKRTGEI